MPSRYLLLFLISSQAVSGVSDILPDVVLYSQALGFYSDGKLVKAEKITDNGPGFVHLFGLRNRGYGASDLIQTITALSQAITSRYPDSERLQIGDLARKSGGQLSGHSSHQNGLDADLIYLRKNRKEQDGSYQGGFLEKFVEKGKLSDNFDVERNWFMFKTLSRISLAQTKVVQRVFVDPEIKRALCDHAVKTGEIQQEVETLRMLRPYELHDDHLHMRILCPKDSTRCIPQEPPPMGSGCNLSQ